MTLPPIQRLAEERGAHRSPDMPKKFYVALFVVLLIGVVVGIDLLFFRHRFWERLMANVGIVLLFAAFYLRFLKSP